MQVIQRDRLASCILAEVEAKHKGQVNTLIKLGKALPPCVRVPRCWLCFVRQPPRSHKTNAGTPPAAHSHTLTQHTPSHVEQVRVLHDIECVGVDYPDDGSVELTLQGQGGGSGDTRTRRRFDWVVGADGVKSAVRGEAEARTRGKVRAVKLPERNEFVYKTLPLDLRPRCVRAWWWWMMMCALLVVD